VPNVSPKGLWARIGPDQGAPVAPTSLHATITGESAPRTVLEVWCSGADGVPQLVWRSGPSAPSGVSATYNNNGKVTVAWTLPSTPEVDSYQVKRPDGSIVGTVSATTSSLQDSSPLAVAGSYSVRGYLAGEYSDPAYSNSLNLSTGPASISGSYNSGTGKSTVTWTAPAWGTPTRYDIYRNGVYLGNVPGTTLSYIDSSVYPGQNHSYVITAKLNSASSGSASTSVGIAARPVRQLWVVCPSFYYPERAWDTYVSLYGHYVDWTPPDGGTWTGYEVQRYHSGAWQPSQTVSRDSFGPYESSFTETVRVRTLSAGGPSEWVEDGPHAPCW
jgi:hypothetical protein